jgi:Hydrazine synthase alpha subunit middle domain
MRHGSPIPLFLGLAALPAVACLLAAQTHAPASRSAVSAHVTSLIAPVIFTAAPVYDSLASLRGGERFPQGAQLMIQRAGSPEPLAPQLAASADASVSFDGKTVLFAGKMQAADPWQIWSVSADGGAPQRLVEANADLIRPLWMPSGRMVYARRTADGFALETAAMDGSAAQKLTFLKGNFIPDDVLRDGRVLFETGYPLGTGATPEMFLVYADGSGVESVRCDHGVAREHGKQMLSGDVVFTHGKQLARFTSALAEEAAVSAPNGEFAGDVAETPDGRWLLSVRRPGAAHFELATWQPGAGTMKTLAQDDHRDLVQPVVLAPHTVPNRHPSALHDWKTGNLLALDARLTRSGPLPAAPQSVRVETIGRDGRTLVLGTAPVENDGSFFVQATGDEPLRFVLLDASGNKIRAEEGWFWVRRGEQRICVGCHTGPERAPDNRVPQILLRSTTPADMTGAASALAAGGH